MSAELAVAVVSWNTRELLARCLSSLGPEAESGRAEVWVVDNASQDGSPDLVRERFGWARLIEPGRNLGFGPAANLAAERTNAPWIVPANADVEVESGTFDALLEAGRGDPRAGALAPRLVGDDGEAQHSVYRFPTLGFTLAFNLGIAQLHPAVADRLCLEGFWDPSVSRRVDWALGALLAVRREAWRRIGGFDPEQWMYAEDLDLGWRLARAGWTTRYVPGAVVRHHGAAATTQLWGEATTERWTESTYAWLQRRRGRAIARATALVNVIGAATRWAGLRLLAAVRPEPYSRRAATMRRWARIHAIGLRRQVRPPSASS